jgi:hypothetical protein
MRYITALVSSVFMFLATTLLSGVVLIAVLPLNWRGPVIQVGLLSANLPSLLAMLLGSITATYTFKASLHSKTGKLYRKKGTKDRGD